MKKKYLFISGAKKWNTLLRKFLNLHKRIKKGNSSEQQLIRMSGKLQSIYKRLEKMQYRVGIKLAGSALALMLISATSFSQDFTSLGNLSFTEDLTLPTFVSQVFADIDGDSDLDLYVGSDPGTIMIFTNDGNGNFTDAGNLQAGGTDIDIGNFSAPVFADIDGDNDLDLYVGEMNGTIKVFTNDGNGNFTDAGNLQADGSDIDVGMFPAPEFADIDSDNDLDLYVGEQNGTIKVFTNNGTGIFSAAGNLQAGGSDIDIGDYSAPVFEDIDDDDDLDLYVGENTGNINVFTNNGTGIFSEAGNLQADGSDIDVGLNSAPVFADIDNDSDLDLYAGEYNGIIKVFTNDGAGNFYAAGDFQVVAGDIDIGTYSTPVFADIDGDSDLDLYIGEQNGHIKVFTNNGTGTFSAAADLQADGTDIDVGWSSKPVFVNIDGDSDLDLYVGEFYGAVKVFINNGTGTFSAAADLQADGVDINAGYGSAPVFADIDNDNDLDLYIGEALGTVKVFTNDGTGIFSAAGNLQADGIDINIGSWSAPTFANLDGSCIPNLFIGNQEGVIAVYEGTDITNPTITCVSNQEVDADETHTYTVVGTEFDPTETDDNCGVASVINDFTGSATLDGAAIPEGTTSIIWTVYDDAGNEETCTFDIEVNVYVSVNDLSELGIFIYPNPSNGIFTIETTDNYNVSVIDITGKLVKEFSYTLSDLQSESQIDLSNQPAGVYFLKFRNDKTVQTVKIIID